MRQMWGTIIAQSMQDGDSRVLEIVALTVTRLRRESNLDRAHLRKEPEVAFDLAAPRAEELGALRRHYVLAQRCAAPCTTVQRAVLGIWFVRFHYGNQSSHTMYIGQSGDSLKLP